MRDFYCEDIINKFIEVMHKRDIWYPNGAGCKVRATCLYYAIANKTVNLDKGSDITLDTLLDRNIMSYEQPIWYK